MGNLQRVTPILNLILIQNLNKINMIIYKVNLCMENGLKSAFISSLKTQINEMLKFNGINNISLFKNVKRMTLPKLGSSI